MASFDTLLPDARAGLPAAPDRLILRALRRGAMELCRQSHVWQERLDPITLVAGTDMYDMDAPSGARVERIMVCKVNGRSIQQARPQDLELLDAATGMPRCFSLMPNTQQVMLHPAPDANAAGVSLSLYVALSPTETATTLPDDLMREYALGIIALAKAQLMGSSPGQPYHNLQEAAVQAAVGADWISRAKRQQHGGGHTELRVRPRPFV